MILDTIAEASRFRVEKAKSSLPLSELKKMLYEESHPRSFHNRDSFTFEKVLKHPDKQIAFICEVKKASPSKGILAEEFPYLDIAKDYELAGAAAISVLTEPQFFMGDDRYLAKISQNVNIPVIRKDFIVDEYQIYEAKVLGADAVLLICSILTTETIKKFISICDELGLSALVETHTEEEVDSAIEAGARVIGVNNRNLQTFEVDLNRSIELRRFVPEDIIFVAESGIKNATDIVALKKAGVNAVLIGEAFMVSANKKEMLKYLRGDSML